MISIIVLFCNKNIRFCVPNFLGIKIYAEVNDKIHSSDDRGILSAHTRINSTVRILNPIVFFHR